MTKKRLIGVILLAMLLVTFLSARNSIAATQAGHYQVGLTTAPQAGPAYPLKQSANHRYLVDNNNVPFLIVGDAPQGMIGSLSLDEAETYLADRQQRGFNTQWVMLLCNAYIYCNGDGTTFDGIQPFTTPGDLSTPNVQYFARADAMINLAAQHGQLVLLDPIETGGWLSILQSNGVTKAFNFGVYLGNRYKNFPNILWMSGSDFQTWRTTSDDNVVRAVAEGIKSVDSQHLQTSELDYFSSGSLDDSTWASLIDLDAAYTYYPTYAQVLKEYNRPSFRPVFMVEANYEDENNTGQDPSSPRVLRRQEYWSQLSGATGQLYGDHYIWPFLDGWLNNLDTPGVTQFGYETSLFASRPWYDLIPDQDHSVVTAGNGTFSDSGPVHSNNYLTAARTPDGHLVIAYMPTSRTITVDMTKLAGPVNAQWFDPANGTYSTVAGSPFTNTGSRQFTPTGQNSDHDSDWVLVLQVALNHLFCPFLARM